MSVDLATAQYRLDEDESKFYKSLTGIQDDAQLREHLFKVQAEALAVRAYIASETPLSSYLMFDRPIGLPDPYPCIRHFRFTR